MNAESDANQDLRRRFDQLFELYYEPVRGFVARRAAPTAVEALVSATFVTAWQRFAAFDGDPLPWLLGSAREQLLISLRPARRVVNPLSHLVNGRREPPWNPPAELAAELGAAMASLGDDDREALLLLAWDGLSPAQAAQVLGWRLATFRVRHRRAQLRIKRELDQVAAVRAEDVQLQHLTARELV